MPGAGRAIHFPAVGKSAGQAMNPNMPMITGAVLPCIETEFRKRFAPSGRRKNDQTNLGPVPAEENEIGTVGCRTDTKRKRSASARR